MLTSIHEPIRTRPASGVFCRGIEKVFGRGESRVQVLRGADFEARPGEITLLVGPSGCGKTTLISIMGGLLTPDAGNVEVLGLDLKALGSGQLADFRMKHVGFIFQQFNLFPALTAVENAAVTLTVQGVTARHAKLRATELLQRLGMGSHVSKYPNQLSGGQQQRVAIARALVHEPRLLICDEPTASLDAASGQAAMQLLRAEAVKPGRSVIVVTHDERVYGFADHIVEMADGAVVRTENHGRLEKC